MEMPGGIKIVSDIHCKTWAYKLVGWRRWVNRWLWIPDRWLKHERERIMYKVGDTIICSYENRAWLERNLPAP